MLPVIREIRATGASLRGTAAALNARGIATARGGTWTAVQVTDILNREMRLKTKADKVSEPAAGNSPLGSRWQPRGGWRATGHRRPRPGGIIGGRGAGREWVPPSPPNWKHRASMTNSYNCRHRRRIDWPVAP